MRNYLNKINLIEKIHAVVSILQFTVVLSALLLSLSYYLNIILNEQNIYFMYALASIYVLYMAAWLFENWFSPEPMSNTKQVVIE